MADRAGAGDRNGRRRSAAGHLMLAGLTLLAAAPAASGPTARGPARLDFSAPLAFADGQCRFSPALDRALSGMLAWDESRQRFIGNPVRLGPLSLTPTLSSGPPAGGGRLYRSSVRLTARAHWNGLTLTGLGAAAGYEYRQRELRFAESAAVTRMRLRRLGTALPAPPAYRRIPTDGCAASIGIESRDRGSALVCTGWC